MMQILWVWVLFLKFYFYLAFGFCWGTQTLWDSDWGHVPSPQKNENKHKIMLVISGAPWSVFQKPRLKNAWLNHPWDRGRFWFILLVRCPEHGGWLIKSEWLQTDSVSPSLVVPPPDSHQSALLGPQPHAACSSWCMRVEDSHQTCSLWPSLLILFFISF